MAMPLASAPPSLIPVRLDPSQGSGKTIEGETTNLSKRAGKDKIEQKDEDAASRKSKPRTCEGEVKGKWWPCTATEEELQSMVVEGFLQPGS
jgi:hypothetical protein